MKLTKKILQDYADYMFGIFRLTPRYRPKSIEMVILNMFLSRLGVTEKNEWLERYATIVGHNVYLPFEIGIPNELWDLSEQIECIAHECQHAHQQSQDGINTWHWRYFTSTAKRANYEADAYSTSLELITYLGYSWNIKHVAESLENYGCNSHDIENVKIRLHVYKKLVDKGAYATYAGIRAIQYLEGIK